MKLSLKTLILIKGICLANLMFTPLGLYATNPEPPSNTGAQQAPRGEGRCPPGPQGSDRGSQSSARVAGSNGRCDRPSRQDTAIEANNSARGVGNRSRCDRPRSQGSAMGSHHHEGAEGNGGSASGAGAGSSSEGGAAAGA